MAFQLRTVRTSSVFYGQIAIIDWCDGATR